MEHQYAGTKETASPYLKPKREREREKGYNNNPSVGSYMFYGIDKCLDATSKSRYGDAIARYELCQMPLINPSR